MLKSTPDQSRDVLTGLMDRAALKTALEAEVAVSTPARQPVGLILFDIDRFKLVNYGYGDQHGDILLQKIAQVAKKKLRKGDSLCRWDGQQFLCLLPNTGKDTTDAVAEELRAAIESLTVQVDSVRIHATASFGVACFPDDGDESRRLISAAGAALYHAKASGRNRIVHTSTLHRHIFGVGNILDTALQENRVLPAYQPIVDLQTNQVVAEEGLACIVMEDNTVMPAESFIEAARELQLTYQIDRCVMLSVFTRCVQALHKQSTMTHFVNISGNLLRHPAVVEELLAAAHSNFASWGDRIGATKPLVIEITERELLDDTKAAREMLKPFMDFGLRLALDDFGSGYSSFKYLADLPFSFLKIEGSLIRRVAEPKVRKIVQGIQDTAAQLGLITLAEYVEDEEIASIVRAIGVNWGQGYYYGKPSLA